MGAVVLIQDECIYKYGTRVKRNEYDAMKLVAEATYVPVPRVVQYEQLGKMGIIAMSVIPGVPLSSTWTTMPSHSRKSVLAQLKGYVAEWRRIAQPAECSGAFVCGAMGGVVSPHVPIPGRRFTGPFLDDPTFRKAIGASYYMHAGRRRTPEEVADALPPSSSVLTHCDLVPRNILVYGTRITGIIDWEFAGWYPEYWEYTNMRHEEWDNMVSSFLEPHPKALNAINSVRHVLF
jgi:hypothetical protein